MQKYLVFIIGVIFLAVSGFMYYRNNNLVKNCTIETSATVVDMKEEISNSDSTTTYTYYPIIEYTANNEIVRETINLGSSRPAYDINEKITILYNPNKINEFIVKGDKSSNILSIVFLILGISAIGCGIKTLITKES